MNDILEYNCLIQPVALLYYRKGEYPPLFAYSIQDEHPNLLP